MKCKDCYVFKQLIGNLADRQHGLSIEAAHCFGKTPSKEQIAAVNETYNWLGNKSRALHKLWDNECATNSCVLV